MTPLEFYHWMQSEARVEIVRHMCKIEGVEHINAVHESSPALAEAIMCWWRNADARTVFNVIDAGAFSPHMMRRLYPDGDVRARASRLAVGVCSASVGHLGHDKRVNACRFLSLKWVMGEVTDEEMESARSIAQKTVRIAKSGAAAWSFRSASSQSAFAAAEAAALAAVEAYATVPDDEHERLRTRVHAANAVLVSLATILCALFPNPCEFDLRDAMKRFDAAVAEARLAIETLGGTA